MDRIKTYLRPALHNILQNKMYASFCIIGTALTFTFVVVLLQLTYSLTTDQPPASKGSRVIRISSFNDVNGEYIGGLRPQEADMIAEQLNNIEACAYLNTELTTFTIGDNLYTGQIAFVNGDFWEINTFEFLKGRAFSSDECNNKNKYIVIKESLSRSCFGSKDALSEKITIQGNEYEVIGIIKDYPYFSSPSDMATIWVPYTYNKFVPSYNDYYTYAFLFSDKSDMAESKRNLTNIIKSTFNKKDLTVHFEDIKTFQETKMALAENNFLAYGVVIAILILLIIPALNIITLNMANSNNRAEEIAIKRALGASRFSAFMQILFENFLLVLTGSILGLILAKPIVKTIESSILGEVLSDGISLITDINYSVIFLGVFPLILVFTLLSGGIPAYITSKSNIVEILKGGAK